MPISGDVVDLDLGAPLEPDVENGLAVESAAQCQHLRSVSPRRVLEVRGNVGGAALARIRDTIAVLLDTP